MAERNGKRENAQSNILSQLYLPTILNIKIDINSIIRGKNLSIYM